MMHYIQDTSGRRKLVDTLSSFGVFAVNEGIGEHSGMFVVTHMPTCCRVASSHYLTEAEVFARFWHEKCCDMGIDSTVDSFVEATVKLQPVYKAFHEWNMKR